MIADFTPLRKGTIADIFSERRNTTPKRVNPLCPSLRDPQCIHYDLEELSEGIEVTRCQNLADRTGSNGWLCEEHNSMIEVRKHRQPVVRDREAEIVANIIAVDSRAIAAMRKGKQ